MGRTVYYDHNGNLIDPPRADPIKPTNGDMIRASTNEELAEFLAVCDASRFRMRSDTQTVAEEKWRWLEWLEQEAE